MVIVMFNYQVQPQFDRAAIRVKLKALHELTIVQIVGSNDQLELSATDRSARFIL